jgi:hypothetical protein
MLGAGASAIVAVLAVAGRAGLFLITMGSAVSFVVGALLEANSLDESAAPETLLGRGCALSTLAVV